MVKSITNAEHYTWGDNCDGWHLLKSDTLSVIQERMPPRTMEKRHFHKVAQQVFYILEGTASFEIEGEVYSLEAHQSIHVPAGKAHCISNQTTTDLCFIVISEPKSQGDRNEIE